MSSPWNVGVYVNLAPRSVRDVSTSTSSFYFYGVVALAWRDDSLCHGPFPPGYLEGTFPYGLGRPYVDGDTYVLGDTDRVSNYSWTRGVGAPGPGVALVQSELVGAAVPAQMSFYVTTTAPSFVDLPDESQHNNLSPPSESQHNILSPPSESQHNNLSPPSCYVVGGTSTSGTYASVQDLSDFPFDSQTFELSYLNRLFDASDMPFVASRSSSTSVYPPNGVDGFDVTQANVSATSEVVASVAAFPKLVLSLRLDRKSTYYVNRFVIPLTLLHVMIAWIPLLGHEDATRGIFSDSVFTTTISFLFVYGQAFPPVAYLTRLDCFFLLCFVHCFAAHLINVTMIFQFRRKKDAAKMENEKSVKRLSSHDEIVVDAKVRVDVNGSRASAASTTRLSAPPLVLSSSSYYYYYLSRVQEFVVGFRRFMSVTNQLMPEFKYDVIFILSSNVIFGAIAAGIFMK